MKAQRLFPSLKLSRFQVWKQAIFLALVTLMVFLLFLGYTDARNSTLDHFSANQLLLASQIAGEMQYRFGIIDSALRLWSSVPDIVSLSPAGMEGMQQILQVHGPDISAVTRLDEHGIILHSVPFVEGTIETDISGQPHVSRLLETRQPVLSDAFLAVQGYWGLAYHVPVFDQDGAFRGSLAVLIPYRDMLDRIFAQTFPGEELHIWLLGRDGCILYSEDEEEEGRLYGEVSRGTGFDSLGAIAARGERRRLTVEFVPDPAGGDSAAVPMLTTVVPFEIGDAVWSVILSTPRATVLRDIAGIRNTFLLGAAGLLLLTLLYSTLKLKAWISASQARKWQDVARIQELLKRTIDQADELVVILDSDEQVVYTNPAMCRITGFGAEILGRRIFDLPLASCNPPMLQIQSVLRRKGGWNGNVEGTGPGSRHFRIHLSISRSESADSGEVHFILIGSDTLAQSELERRLHEQQKMEAIGQLAGGVAHDFNNLLVGIQGYAELLERRYEGDSEIQRAVRVIQDAVHRGSELTRQLLGYARKGKHKIEPVDLAICVRNVWMLLKRTMDRRIDVELDLEEGVVVRGDPAQLEQVILNLAVNARDAMLEGGRLRFELRRTEVPSSVLHGAPSGDSMELAVLRTSDTGCGIIPEHLDHIFEPFFTTKREMGTGMGLATVFGIITNHGGWIDVESSPGHGATFVIYLPLGLQAGAEGESGPALVPVAPSPDRRTILLVDDEPVVLATTSELLREIGYEVLEALDGETALGHLRSRGGGIDAVLLDLSMPGMDGAACFAAIRGMLPDLPVILASGYSRDGRVQELLDQGADDFLQKPYRLSDLASMLLRHTGLDRRSPMAGADPPVSPETPSGGAP